MTDMTEQTHSTLRIEDRPLQCGACGYYCHPCDERCPQCHEVLARPLSNTGDLVDATRFSLSETKNSRDKIYIPPNAIVILQFLPSDVCLPLNLDQPVILGRAALSDTDHDAYVIDLTEFQALELGVSRQHCRLQRIDTDIVATDLDSSNLSYLRGEKMHPHQDYVLTHRDRLILGRLHVNVFFSIAVT